MSHTNADATGGLMDYQTIEMRKVQFPDRPLIRISSTFFWTLSADYDLAPIPELAAKAHARRVDAINLGRTNVEEEVTYETLKVGQQVQKYAFPLKAFLSLSY
jgi:isopenicillin N synthase-like dioxygenase